MLNRNLDVTLVCDMSGQPASFQPQGETGGLDYVGITMNIYHILSNLHMRLKARLYCDRLDGNIDRSY